MAGFVSGKAGIWDCFQVVLMSDVIFKICLWLSYRGIKLCVCERERKGDRDWFAGRGAVRESMQCALGIIM